MQEIFEKIKERLHKEDLEFMQQADVMACIDNTINQIAEEYIKQTPVISVSKLLETSINAEMERFLYENPPDMDIVFEGIESDGWIPCEIKTPEFEIYSVERLWVTMHRKGCNYYFVRTLRWNGCQGRWEWDNGKTLSDAYEVVAWRQFDVLKPYKPEGEKDGKTENN